MQHVFRLSQKRKPIASEREYGQRLGGALEALVNGRILRSASRLSLRDQSQQPVEERVVDTLRVHSETWDLLDTRRLALEELRPDDRLVHVHQEAVKSLRAALELWNREGQQGILLLQGQEGEAARQLRDVDHWQDMMKHVEKKLRASLHTAWQQHPDLLRSLHLPATILDFYDLESAHEPEDFSSSRAGPSLDDHDDKWPTVELVDLAKYLRLEASGERDDAKHPTEAAIDLQLEFLVMNPERWDDLPAERLALLVAWGALRLGYGGDDAQIPPLARLYQTFARRIAVDRRRQVLLDVSLLLESDGAQIRALAPFIFNDPDQFVISSAALNLATISPLYEGDPLTGPKRCLQIVAEHSDGTDVTTVGVLTGLLALGDRRIVPLLDGIWSSLSRDSQLALTTAPCDWVCASMVEFWLRWLEDVEENGFGFPAQAVMRAAVQSEGNEVLDVRRRFPAPFNLSEVEIQREAPVRYMHTWSTHEFGRIIEPRLRRLYLREIYSPVFPAVMEAWGLDPGNLDEHEQTERIVRKFSSDRLAFRRQASKREARPDDPTVEGRALSIITKTFSMTHPLHALILLRELVEKLDPEQSKAVLRLLEHQFGPDLDVAQRDMAFGWVHARPSELRTMGVDLPDLQ